MTPPARPAAATRQLLASTGVLLALMAALSLPATAQNDTEDPNLDQTIDGDQPIATGPAVLEAGHVDIGPRFVDGELTLLVHDDTDVPSVWRRVDDTVMRVGDDALQVVPDDPTYDFLGVEPGAEVHIIPQVERPGVVWVGWNTQDPEVMEALDRGATLTLLGVQGPGELTVFLQSGALGDPEVLWQSTERGRQPIWVEVNTHTHSNWVFTEPGVYLVRVEVSGEQLGGEPVSDVRTLRFAIGDATDPEEAREAELTEVVAPDDDAGAADPTGAEREDPAADEDGGGAAPAVIGTAAAAAVLLVLVVVVALRGRGAKQRAERERTDGENGPQPSGDRP